MAYLEKFMADFQNFFLATLVGSCSPRVSFPNQIASFSSVISDRELHANKESIRLIIIRVLTSYFTIPRLFPHGDQDYYCMSNWC